jgi:hypothetical protein
LYATATPGGYESSAPPALVKVNLQTGQFSTIYQSQSAYAFHDLAVIPGTTSFYTRIQPSSFALLDTASGRIGALGTSSCCTNEFVFQNFPVVVAKPASGRLTYTIEDVCQPASCLATVLTNDSAMITGPYTNQTPRDSIFVASPGAGITKIIHTGSMVAPASMNNRGDIVGSISSPGKDTAFLYSASTGQLYNLNPIFGWESGRANYINDRGFITGNGSPGPLNVLGNALDSVAGFTNTSFLLGVRNGSGFVLSPGGQALTVPVAPLAFNNLGQFVGFASPGNPAIPNGGTGLFTPTSGFRAIAPVQYFPTGLNDAGIVLFATGPSVLDTTGSIPELSGTPVNIRDLVTPNSEWSNFSAVGLNLNGQIAVIATSIKTGRTTTLLLTPHFNSDGVSSAVTPRQSSAVRSRGPGVLNGIPLEYQKLIRIERPGGRMSGWPVR